MTRTELIRKYRQILSEAENHELTVAQITAEVDKLVRTSTGQPLTSIEKKEILEEIFEVSGFQKSFPTPEFGRVYGNESINEADNSHILDVISALKRGANE